LTIVDQTQLVADIKRMLAERRGIWLAHNYQRPEVQDAADLTGDSLALSLAAAKTDAELIVFCGVHFMAESAAIVAPDKRVLLPAMNAGCPMANMITAAQLVERKKTLGPDTTVVAYVNTTAAVKAESDICCTSANAVRVVAAVPTPKVFFVPDQNLAQWTAAQTAKTVEWWPGYCHVHHHLRATHVAAAKAAWPGAVVVVHPECRPEVTALADVVASTSGMLKWAKTTTAAQALVGTEIGMLHPLRLANSRTRFIPIEPDIQICGNMKLTTLESVAEALHDMDAHTVYVPHDVQVRARQALDRMLAIPA
jgi:quinolinate synthase